MTLPYRSSAEKCCDACVFGAAEHGRRYEHAEWCQTFGARSWRAMTDQLMDAHLSGEPEEEECINAL